MTDALYVRDGDTVTPTELTGGPWSEQAQHGGPAAALLASAIERVRPPADPMALLRVTVELVRPVPLTPLRLETQVVKPGRNVQLIDAILTAEGTEVARARGLRIRQTDIEVPLPSPDLPSLPPAEATADEWHGQAFGFVSAVELRFVAGSWAELGPTTVWGRLRVPVIAGEPTSPTVQAVALADFGNGLSRVVGFDTHRFINPDLTVALSRPPEGPWVGFDTVTRLSSGGFGQAESQIFDLGGPVGRSVQTLLVDPVRS